MNNNIFISIASYRDKNCPKTIKSIYDNAKYPENIFIGICQQNNEEVDIDCLQNLDENYKSQIRIIRINYKETKGVTHARYLCSTLWKNEKYFLQIDSHTHFIKNWDIKCIYTIDQLKKNNISQKPVLSHYPRDYTDIQKNDNFNITYVKYYYYMKDVDIIKFDGARFINSKNSFIKTPFVTGNFLFTESKFLEEIPYDPTLDYLHQGEEILHSLRFYTHGYDIYVPNETIAYHLYNTKEPKIWIDDKNIEKKRAKVYKKIMNVFNSYNNTTANLYLGNYGLGNKRSLNSYRRYLKIYKTYLRKFLINLLIFINISIIIFYLLYIIFKKLF
jgi:[Skp1-protein]-hydroxyproline N-acetylglucosaminyltransferase